MVISLNLISDIFGPPNKEGRQKVIKKNVKYKKTFETNTIHVQQYIDNKGIVSKNYCIILEGELTYKALHKFEDIEKLLSPIKIKGFKC